MVPPYPQFTPSTCLLTSSSHSNNCLPTYLLNTGNLFHLLTLRTHTPKPPSHPQLILEVTDSTAASSWQPPNLTSYVKRIRSLTVNNHGNRLLLLPKRFFKRRSDLPAKKPLKTPLATVYDTIDPPDDQQQQISFKLFRKRKLADKMYQFSDDEENDEPVVLTPRVTSTPTSTLLFQPLPKSVHFINRTYLPNADETVSTTTEIDDESADLFPVALPVDIFDPATGQLSMIRNNKRLPNTFKLSQITLDIEILSNEVAAIACKQQNLNFKFIVDFDTTVLHVNHTDNSIIAYTNVLVQAR
jgi:hypothetical protein